MNIQEITQAIDNGELDASLSDIAHSIRHRQDRLNSSKIYDFKVGDRVKFNSRCRPTYMIGTNATITEIMRTRVTVRLDSSVGRFSGNAVKTCTSIIDKI